MPYSIVTKDGIKINNIPDDVDPNSDELRQRVAQIRAAQSSQAQQPAFTPTPVVVPGSEVLSPEARQELSPEQQLAMIDQISRQQQGAGMIQAGEAPAATSEAQRQTAMENLKVSNPALAEMIEGMGGMEKFLAGAGEEFASLVRGGGKLVGADLFPAVETPESQALRQVSGEAQFGGGVAAVAPSLATGPATGTIRSAATRAAVSGGVGAAEGGLRAAGQGGTAEEILSAAALQGLTGGAFEVLPVNQVTRAGTNRFSRGVEKIGKTTKERLAGETPTQQILRERLAANDPSVEFLGKTLDDGKVVTSQATQKAVKQGFDQPVLRSIETATPQTKADMRRMLEVLKRRRIDADYRASNRVTDVIGANVYKRYKALDNLRRQFGRDVDRVAKDLQGEFELPVDSLIDDLDQLGVSITRTDTGALKADFSNVDAPDIAGTRKSVNSLLSRINRSKGTAVEAHKLKRLVDGIVDFGKLPTEKSKLAPGIERALKNFRANVNNGLGDLSPEYRAANQRYASVIEPLSDMDKIFKTFLNLNSEDAIASGAGTRAARTIMSNNVSRAGMLDLLSVTDDVLAKEGVTFQDNLIKQAVFADELERFFGSEASTSLGGAAQRAQEKAIRSVLGEDMIKDVAIEGYKKLKGINEENAIKALEDMLTQQP